MKSLKSSIVRSGKGPMKKTMKRMLCTAAAIMLSFSLAACNNSEPAEDPKVLLENASEKMKELDSLSMNANLSVNMEMSSSDSATENLSLDMPIEMTVEMAGIQSDLMYHTIVDASLFGTNISTEQTYYDGVVYTNTDGQKTMMTMDVSEARQMANVGEVSTEFKNMKASKDGDKTIVTIEPTKEELTQLMDTLGSLEGSTMDEETLAALSSLTFDAFVITINKDGYIENEKFGFSAEEEGIKVVFTAEIKVSGYDSTTVEMVDPGEYEALNY